MSKNASKSASSKTTASVVARVQRAVAHQNNGGTPKGSYVGRMQAVVAKTSNGKK